MKRLLGLFLALVLSSSIAYARENVEVVWWAGATGGPANIMRETIEEANKIQKKYNFIFEHKPGGGGSVAISYVKSKAATGAPVVLSGGDAFHARQFLMRDGVFQDSEWKMILPQITIPQGIAASKKRPWSTLLTQKSVTVGIGGLGTNQHLVAEQLKQHFETVIVVPHSKFDQVIQLMGGHIDLAVDWAATLPQYDQLEIVGITGRKSFPNAPLLSTKNFKNMDRFSSRIWLITPVSMPENQYKEINDILVAAQNNSARIKDMLQQEMSEILVVKRETYPEWLKNASEEVKFRTNNVVIDR